MIDGRNLEAGHGVNANINISTNWSFPQQILNRTLQNGNRTFHWRIRHEIILSGFQIKYLGFTFSS